MNTKRKEDGATAFGLYLGTASYRRHGTTLCLPSCGFSCQYLTQRQVNGQAQPRNISSGEATLTTQGWGADFITVSTPSDLEPYLVDGCLKLKATVTLI
jgi:hypothetical protein